MFIFKNINIFEINIYYLNFKYNINLLYFKNILLIIFS